MFTSPNFMSAGHRDVVARILDTLWSSASVVLTAPAGAGKTAVLNAVASNCANRSWRLIRVAGSASEPLGMRTFAAQLAHRPEASGMDADHVGQALEALTTAEARRNPTLLVVDGAETLLPDTLRVIQLACEMQPLLQVLFAGRPEFGDRLAHPELARLQGRLAPPFSLPPLSEREAAALIAHRMRAAGLDSTTLAGNAILKTLISHGAGNPGRIGAVLDRALADRQGHATVPAPTEPGDERRNVGSGTAQADFRQPTPGHADQAAAPPVRSIRRRLGMALPTAAAVALLGAVGLGAVAFRASVFSHHPPWATVENRSMPGQLALLPDAPQPLAVVPDRAVAMPTGTAPASDTGEPVDGTPAPSAAPDSPPSPDGNGVAAVLPAEMATVVVTPGSAGSAPPAAMPPETAPASDAGSPADYAPPPVAAPDFTPPPDENRIVSVLPQERATVVVTPGSTRSAPVAATTAGEAGSAAATTPSPALGGTTRLANAAKPPVNAVPPSFDAGRTGRITALSTAAPDDRRCRDVLRRMQLGEGPTDVEKGFLRTDCRRER